MTARASARIKKGGWRRKDIVVRFEGRNKSERVKRLSKEYFEDFHAAWECRREIVLE